MPKSIYDELKQKLKMLSTSVTLSAYNNTEIPVIGKCIATIQIKERKTPVLFIIANINSTAILGQSTCEKLQLIRRIYKITRNPQGNIESQEQMTRSHQLIHENHVGQSKHEIQDTRKQILKQYEKCFGDLRTLPGEHHITLDKNVPPVIHAVRKILYAILPNLKNELERMSKMGVIVPVNGPSKWVVTEKPNKNIRVCLDPKDLKKAILREHFKIPTADEIFSQMHDAKYFTKLDASSGYWQIKSMKKVLTS